MWSWGAGRLAAGPGGSREGRPRPSTSSGCPVAPWPPSQAHPPPPRPLEGLGHRAWWGRARPCLAPWRASVGWREDHTAGPPRPGASALQELPGFFPLGSGVGVPGAVRPGPAPGGLPRGGLWLFLPDGVRAMGRGSEPFTQPRGSHSGDPALEILPSVWSVRAQRLRAGEPDAGFRCSQTASSGSRSALPSGASSVWGMPGHSWNVAGADGGSHLPQGHGAAGSAG